MLAAGAAGEAMMVSLVVCLSASFDVSLAFPTLVGAVPVGFGGLARAGGGATIFLRDGVAAALAIVRDFVVRDLAVADLAVVFPVFAVLEDFLCDFLDIRLPFVAFRRTMNRVLWFALRNRSGVVLRVLMSSQPRGAMSELKPRRNPMF
jgi:hypothetical protein